MGKAGDTLPGLTVVGVRQQHPTDHPETGQGEGAQWGFWAGAQPQDVCVGSLIYSLWCFHQKSLETHQDRWEK